MASRSEEVRRRTLARLRSVGRDVLPHPGPSPLEGGRSGMDVLETFAEAFRASGGEVVRPGGLEGARSWLLGFASEFAGCVCDGDVPEDLRPSIPQVSAAEAELGVSVALCGAASTGSLVVGSSAGRRAQILPACHLIWVDAADLYPTLDAALARLDPAFHPAALAIHSGPSKSADIGQVVVRGVHGPGRVVAAVFRDV